MNKERKPRREINFLKITEEEWKPHFWQLLVETEDTRVKEKKEKIEEYNEERTKITMEKEICDKHVEEEIIKERNKKDRTENYRGL